MPHFLFILLAFLAIKKGINKIKWEKAKKSKIALNFKQ